MKSTTLRTLRALCVIAPLAVMASCTSQDEDTRAQFTPDQQPQRYTGKLISLDVQKADISSVFRIFSEISGTNIVAGKNVTGTVTLKLVDVPWDQALDIVLRSHGLHRVQEGNVIRIHRVEEVRTP
jgi:type IV pilus assembly protein PilQ